MFNFVKKIFGDSWDNELLDEIERRKFLAYTQTAAKDDIFKETPALFNEYITDLDKAFKHFKKHIKMTYGNPDFFKDKYESRNRELMDEMFIIGEKCITGYTKNKYVIQTEWNQEIYDIWYESVKDDMYVLLQNHYTQHSDEILLSIAETIAKTFNYYMNKIFPNQIILLENYLIDDVHPVLKETIDKVKMNSMDNVLDLFEEKMKENIEKTKLTQSIIDELHNKDNINKIGFIQ